MAGSSPSSSLEQLVHLVGVGGRHRVEQAAELPGQRFAERARAGRDDLAELDVGGAQVGERLRDLLDRPSAASEPRPGELGDDACAGAGDLPTRRADAGRLDRQRHPIQLGDLAVLGRTHCCSVPNFVWRTNLPTVRMPPDRRQNPSVWPINPHSDAMCALLRNSRSRPRQWAARPVREGRDPFRRSPRTGHPEWPPQPPGHCAPAASGRSSRAVRPSAR